MSVENQLADEVGKYYKDLNGFIRFAFPWGEPGVLEHFEGPERWAMELADDISEQVAENKFDGVHPVPCIYVGVASGNGCAKSTFAAMLTQWIMCTRPFSLGTVTANTGSQLKAKTWVEQEKWAGLCIASDWFEVKSEIIRHKIHRGKWAVTAQTWNLKNPQAFAGQHSRIGTSFYIFDEASHIPEAIFEQADGGLTDGEPMLFLFGNPGNRGGRLYRSVFGDLGGQYLHRRVDSRDCKFTNKAQLQKWVEERGEDSDWVRVHVKGLAPNADELQFIDSERIAAARVRDVPPSDGTDPLIMGIDFARGGSNWNRISYRRGRDMRSIASKGIAGEKTRDTQLMISIVLEEIRDKKPDVVFGDATGVGGPIMDGVRALVKNVPIVDVQFAGKSPDERYGNWRAYMWAKHKEWIQYGCIENNEDLANEIGAPEYYHIKDRLYIESKEEMEARNVMSPDWADSEILTHAMPVAPLKNKHISAADAMRRAQRNQQQSKSRGWMRT
jgi:hypothetical protein